MTVQAKLTVVGGKASKRTVALQLPTSIGRSRDADLTVAHPQISREHCELVENDGLIVIRDVGSLNGTYVNSHRVKEAPLPPEATFSIGPLTFRVRYQYDGDEADLPPVILAEEPAATPTTGEISETLPVADEPAEEELVDFETLDGEALEEEALEEEALEEESPLETPLEAEPEAVETEPEVPEAVEEEVAEEELLQPEAVSEDQFEEEMLEELLEFPAEDEDSQEEPAMEEPAMEEPVEPKKPVKKSPEDAADDALDDFLKGLD